MVFATGLLLSHLLPHAWCLMAQALAGSRDPPSYQQRPPARHSARNALQRLTVYQVTQLLLIPKVLPHRYPEQRRLWLAQKFGAGPQITAISGSPWVPPATVEHDQPAPAISEPQNDIPTIPTSW